MKYIKIVNCPFKKELWKLVFIFLANVKILVWAPRVRNLQWCKHAAEALEIALRDDDSDDNNIVNDSDDNNMVNSTELDASQASLDDNIELESSSCDNAFEMDENNYVDWFFGDRKDESENNNAKKKIHA